MANIIEIGVRMTNQILSTHCTITQALTDAVNIVIDTSKLQETDRATTLAILTSLKAASDITSPELSKTIHLRIIAIRNDIPVCRITQRS